jgi:hypothetical protein
MLAGHLDLQLTAEWLAARTTQSIRQSGHQVPLNRRMRRRSAHHGDGLESVELVTQFLPFLPREELGETHRPAQRDVHDTGSERNVAFGGVARNLS